MTQWKAAMSIRDITIPMGDSLACWPGDAPFRFTWTCRTANGATVSVGQLQVSVHSCTHTDSPFHFDDTGATSDFLDLNRFIGPARVISLTDRMRIRREELELFDLSSTPRV